MSEASRMASAGAPHGTVLLAEEQTGGVGRLGRTWISEPEVGIYFSAILRLQLPPASLPMASMVAGLATAKAIEQVTFLSCDLRWPNDVLVNERKVAGVLANLLDRTVIVGIGINVNHTHFPATLRTPATSLRIEKKGDLQSREEIILALITSLDSFCSTLENQGPGAVAKAFTQASSYASGRCVSVEDTGQRGVTAGLDGNGFLLLRLDDGQVRKITSGGLRPELA